MKLNYDNKIKIGRWCKDKNIKVSSDPMFAFLYYKECQFYGEITKSISPRNISSIVKKQIDFIQKSVINIMYEENNRSAKGISSGYVYAISNPAWENYIKIGSTIDVYDRLSSYQTSCPMRDYVLVEYIYTDDRLSLEREVISMFESRNEWVIATPSQIKSVLNKLKKYPEKEIMKFAIEVAMNNLLSIRMKDSKNLNIAIKFVLNHFKGHLSEILNEDMESLTEKINRKVKKSENIFNRFPIVFRDNKISFNN